MDVFVLRSVVGGGSLHTTQGGGGCNPQAPPFHVCLLDRKRSYIPTHPQKHTKYTRSKAERERIHINLNTSIHTHVYKLYYYQGADMMAIFCCLLSNASSAHQYYYAISNAAGANVGKRTQAHKIYAYCSLLFPQRSSRFKIKVSCISIIVKSTMKCCFPSCGVDFHNLKNNYKDDNISHHKFPTNIDARDRWLNAIANADKNC